MYTSKILYSLKLNVAQKNKLATLPIPNSQYNWWFPKALLKYKMRTLNIQILLKSKKNDSRLFLKYIYVCVYN